MKEKERQNLVDELSGLFGFEIPIDVMFTKLFGKLHINVSAVAHLFTKHDSDYNCHSFVHRGEPNISLNDYIERRFGKDTLDKFNSLIR